MAIADDERPVVCGLRDLVVGEDVRGDNAVRDLAFGQVGVLQAEHGLQIRESEAVGGQLRGVGVHTHRGQCTAADADLADALNL